MHSSSPSNGIKFSISDEGYYETEAPTLSGVSIRDSHDWTSGNVSEIRIADQPARDADIAPARLPQLDQSLFPRPALRPRADQLPGAAGNSRRKNSALSAQQARDIYDLGTFRYAAARPKPDRRLSFLSSGRPRHLRSARLMAEVPGRSRLRLDDLRQLLRRTIAIDRDRITARLRQRFSLSFETFGRETNIGPLMRNQRETGACDASVRL